MTGLELLLEQQDIMDHYDDWEDEYFVTGLGYKYDDHGQYDGRSHARKIAWIRSQRKIRQAQGINY